VKKGPRQIKPDNAQCRHMDEALSERPVSIVWRKKPNGIWIAIHVDDPHGDPIGTGAATANYRAWQRQQQRSECTDENLLAAARTEL